MTSDLCLAPEGPPSIARGGGFAQPLDSWSEIWCSPGGATESVAPCMFHRPVNKPTTGGAGRVPLGRRSPTRSVDRPAGSAPSQPAQARGPKPDSQGRADRVPRPRRTPMTAPVVGIDVSKDHLDVHVRPTGETFRAGTDDPGLATVVTR